MYEQTHIGLPIGPWQRDDTPPEPGDAAYGEMILALRTFLDKLAGARADEATIRALTGDLRGWAGTLESVAVDEQRQVYGHRFDLPGRGQATVPACYVEHSDPQSIRGTVVFGRYYLGGNGAAHGGAIPLLFDDLFGYLVTAHDRPRSRTAYLHVDYRSITPIDTKLDVSARIIGEEGRKRIVRGEIRHGDIVCAEGEGLFVALKPGQP